MKRTIKSQSGHTIFVKDIKREDLPAHIKHADGYTHYYVAKNADDKGCEFFYIARGFVGSPREYHVWYAKTGAFWSCYGKSLQDAIDGAQRDGWLYA